MTSPFSLYSPVCATETGWWPLEATGHQGRNVHSPAGWRVASGGCWSVLFGSVACGSLKKEKRKATYAEVQIEWLLTETAESIPAVTAAAALSGLPPFFHSSFFICRYLLFISQLLSSYSSSSSWFVFSRSVSFRLVLGSQPRQGGGLVCWGDSGWFDCCVLIITRIMKGS